MIIRLSLLEDLAFMRVPSVEGLIRCLSSWDVIPDSPFWVTGKTEVQRAYPVTQRDGSGITGT